MAQRKVRRFDVARILSVKPTHLRFDPPAGLSLTEHVEEGARLFAGRAAGGEVP